MPKLNTYAKSVNKKAFSLRRLVALALSIGIASGFGIVACAAFPQEEATNKIESPLPACPITLTVDGETRTISASAKTVGELFAQEKIVLGKQDRCTVPLNTQITPDLSPLVVTRLKIETEKEWTPIPFTTKRQLTPKLRFGQSKVARAGVKGTKLTVYRVVTRDGETTRTPIETRTKPAKPALILSGMRGASFGHMLASRSSLSGARILTMRATGYGPGCNGRWGARTASGMRPGFGIVAVDPRFIRLGTRLYIENYGYAIAGDTGGAIKGNRIDLGYDSYSQALAVGRRTVRVMILP